MTLDAGEPKVVTLRGQVVDLNVSLKKQHKVDIAAKAEPVWVLKAVDGKLFTLLKTRRSLARWRRELILPSNWRAKQAAEEGRVSHDSSTSPVPPRIRSN